MCTVVPRQMVIDIFFQASMVHFFYLVPAPPMRMIGQMHKPAQWTKEGETKLVPQNSGVYYQTKPVGRAGSRHRIAFLAFCVPQQRERRPSTVMGLKSSASCGSVVLARHVTRPASTLCMVKQCLSHISPHAERNK